MPRCDIVHGGVWQNGQHTAEGINLLWLDGQTPPVALYRTTAAVQREDGKTAYGIIAIDQNTQEQIVVREAVFDDVAGPDAGLLMTAEAQAMLAQMQAQGWRWVDTERSHADGDQTMLKIVYKLEREDGE